MEITFEWLRSRGFEIHSRHQDNRPHMQIRINPSDDEFLEVADACDGSWHCWLRHDDPCRCVHVRHLRTTEQIERLYLGITDKPLVEVEWDPVRFAAALEMERGNCVWRYKEFCYGR